jgi:hypothetical protein
MEPNGQKKQRRRSHVESQPLPPRTPVRLAPTDDPVEAVERMISRRQLKLEEGDIVISRETAGLLRHTPGFSGSKYRLSVSGQRDGKQRVFAMYERAVMDGEALAAERRVRLFYAEDAGLTLLKDYRPAAPV